MYYCNKFAEKVVIIKHTNIEHVCLTASACTCTYLVSIQIVRLKLKVTIVHVHMLSINETPLNGCY